MMGGGGWVEGEEGGEDDDDGFVCVCILLDTVCEGQPCFTSD